MEKCPLSLVVSKVPPLIAGQSNGPLHWWLVEKGLLMSVVTVVPPYIDGQ